MALLIVGQIWVKLPLPSLLCPLWCRIPIQRVPQCSRTASLNCTRMQKKREPVNTNKCNNQIQLTWVARESSMPTVGVISSGGWLPVFRPLVGTRLSTVGNWLLSTCLSDIGTLALLWDPVLRLKSYWCTECSMTWFNQTGRSHCVLHLYKVDPQRVRTAQSADTDCICVDMRSSFQQHHGSQL